MLDVMKKGTMKEKEKRQINLKHAISIELLILAVVFVALFWGESRITRRAAEKKLMERSESTYNAFTGTMNQVDEISAIYRKAMQEKADALVYYYDHSEGITEEDLRSLCDIYDVEQIYLSEEWGGLPEDVASAVFYTGRTADGHTIAIQQSTTPESEIQLAASNSSSVFLDIRQKNDLYVIFHAKNGYIINASDETMDSEDQLHKITEFGIDLENIDTEKAGWMTINGNRYYAFCYDAPDSDWMTLTGIKRNDLFEANHVFVRLLFGIIALIMTVLVTYLFFARQQSKYHYGHDTDKTLSRQKLVVTAVFGLILAVITSYYIQSLYSMSVFSVTSNKEKQQAREELTAAETNKATLSALYDKISLTEARIVSHILSAHPELRTKKNLNELSELFDLEYIMMFDENGVETLSNSGIMGFVISDDPQSQSYAFNVLKYGIPYVVQEAQPDDLTGRYHQFIGVITNDTEGQYDGFLQICISPEEEQHIIKDLSLSHILNNVISMSENEILAIDKNTNLISFYSGNTAFTGYNALDLGMNEEQLKGNYLGLINLQNDRLYADSFEINDHYIYIASSRSVLFTGRVTMTIFVTLVALIAMAIYTLYFKSVDVVAPLSISDVDPYIDVNTPGAQNKKTLNILARVMKTQIFWRDKPSEEKIATIVKFVILLIGLNVVLINLLQGILYSDNSVFAFIMGNRWNKGFNVFAITKALIFILNMNVVIYILDQLLNLFMKLATPKNETILRLVKSLCKYIFVLSIIYYSLSQFGFDSRSLLASAGLLTLVVGLGAKDLVTDILAGIFIIFENEFQVGDIIEVNGYKGRVLEIGIRTTKIMNTLQDVKSISNRNLTNIVNKTKRNSYCDVIINVPFDQSIDEIESMLREELPKIKEKCSYIIDGPTYGGVDDMSGRSMKLSIRTECLESHKFEVRTTVNKEIKDMFEKNGFKLV